MSQERDLEGKNVVATGGASGITKAICDHFLKKGINKLAILDLNEEAGDSVASEFNKVYGAGKVVFKKCDVTNDSDVDSIVDDVLTSFGTIDVLVNGAGFSNERNWKLCVKVNLNALIYLTLKIHDLTRADRGGRGATIVNMSSVRGVRPVFIVPVYVATKFGVVGFSKSLGDKLYFDRTRVRVLTLCPGPTETPTLAAGKNLPFPPELSAIIAEHVTDYEIIQSADHVGAKTVDIFEKGESGSAWIVENNAEPYQV